MKQTLNSIVFINNLPTLDLHGFDYISAKVAINDFIRDNQVMKNAFLVIIHGIGSGIVKKATIETLRQNKIVLDFKTYMYNNGCTIVQINV